MFLAARFSIILYTTSRPAAPLQSPPAMTICGTTRAATAPPNRASPRRAPPDVRSRRTAAPRRDPRNSCKTLVVSRTASTPNGLPPHNLSRFAPPGATSYEWKNRSFGTSQAFQIASELQPRSRQGFARDRKRIGESQNAPKLRASTRSLPSLACPPFRPYNDNPCRSLRRFAWGARR